jgi:hypothetical protein
MVKKYVCRSKSIPCPAGDRCPAHRGRAQAIKSALENSDLKAASLLKKEELSDKEKRQLKDFVDNMKIRLKKDGSTVITVTEKEEIFSKENGNKTLTVTRAVKKKIIADAIHPADGVDKTRRIIPNRQTTFGPNNPDLRKTQDQEMQEALDELYDGKVQLETKSKFNTILINKLDVEDDYKNHGIESHILASVVVARRPDLYDTASKADVPYAEYRKAGFEPNPYYWAGKTHEGNGHTYPSKETLDEYYNDYENEARWDCGYMNLGSAKDVAEYPYIRFKHGYRFDEVPLTNKSLDKETKDKLRASQTDRWDRTEISRAAWNPLDIH